MATSHINRMNEYGIDDDDYEIYRASIDDEE